MTTRTTWRLCIPTGVGGVQIQKERLLVADLPDNVGLSVAVDGIQVEIPDGGQCGETDSGPTVPCCRFLVSLRALTCAKHFNLCQV